MTPNPYGLLCGSLSFAHWDTTRLNRGVAASRQISQRWSGDVCGTSTQHFCNGVALPTTRFKLPRRQFEFRSFASSSSHQSENPVSNFERGVYVARPSPETNGGAGANRTNSDRYPFRKARCYLGKELGRVSLQGASEGAEFNDIEPSHATLDERNPRLRFTQALCQLNLCEPRFPAGRNERRQGVPVLVREDGLRHFGHSSNEGAVK
jgi:hypothetical protein